jgi:hypothetical protein
MQRNPNLHAAPRSVANVSPDITEYMRGRVKAAGGDPARVPDIPFRFMRPKEVCEMLAISIATYYRMIEDGTLPRPIPIDRASSRAAG